MPIYFFNTRRWGSNDDADADGSDADAEGSADADADMGNADGVEIKDDIPLLVQNLIGDQKSSSVQLTLTKAEAALFLWNHSVLAKSRKTVIDAGAVVPMCALLKAGAVSHANIHGKGRSAEEEWGEL